MLKLVLKKYVGVGLLLLSCSSDGWGWQWLMAMDLEQKSIKILFHGLNQHCLIQAVGLNIQIGNLLWKINGSTCTLDRKYRRLPQLNTFQGYFYSTFWPSTLDLVATIAGMCSKYSRVGALIQIFSDKPGGQTWVEPCWGCSCFFFLFGMTIIKCDWIVG